MRSLEFGVFARVFDAAPASRIAANVAAAGYTLAQLNLSALGLPTIPLPDEWDKIDSVDIRTAFDSQNIRIWGLSCSYNMAHPDPLTRRAGTDAAGALIAHASTLGATAVTLCTGTRNPERMWSPHPDNNTNEAWHDLRTELDILLTAATEANIMLAVEPEPGNIVRDTDCAVRLLDELGADASRITVIADPANLLREHPDPTTHPRILRHACVALGTAIGCIHAKDLVPWSDALAGRGVVDYRLVGQLRHELLAAPPVIVQDASPSNAAAVRALVSASMARGGDSH